MTANIENNTKIQTVFYCNDEGLKPYKKHSGDAGFDLRSKFNHWLNNGDTEIAETGVYAVIPEGYVGIVKPRSGLGVKGLNLTAGVIDSSYRGEIKVILQHFGKERLHILPGDRIAQLIVIPCLTSYTTVIGTIPDDTERGADGFGSSGIK